MSTTATSIPDLNDLVYVLKNTARVPRPGIWPNRHRGEANSPPPVTSKTVVEGLVKGLSMAVWSPTSASSAMRR
eukprot:423434-Prorocentrum_minimum.AAC.1